MLSGLLQIPKIIGYKIKYGKKLRLEGRPCFGRGASIRMQEGLLCLGKLFFAKEGSHVAVWNGGQLRIGRSVTFGRNSILVCHDSITIGDNCAIAPNVLIYDHDHEFGPKGILPGFKTAPVVIEQNCWIGAGVTILRGTHIGEGSIIGAGCIVKGEIPPYSLVTSDRSLTIRPLTDHKERIQEPDEV